MPRAIFGECLNYKVVLEFCLRHKNVTFLVLKMVTFYNSDFFGPQKNGAQISDHFPISNIPQIWPLGILIHEFITFGCNLCQISILVIFGLILGIFALKKGKK